MSHSPLATMTTSLGARVLHHEIDRELEDYVTPSATTLHGARARQLTTRRHRSQLAGRLETLVVRGRTQQVQRAEPVLLRAAALLRSDAPVNACGVARLDRIAADNHVHGRWETELADMVGEAIDTLEKGSR